MKEEIKSSLITMFKSGLTDAILAEAVDFGELYRKMSTKFDPVTTRGYLAWAKTNGALREDLAAEGWEMENYKNVPIAATPCGRASITAWAGNSAVGKMELDPQPRRVKGAGSIWATTQRQFNIFESKEERRQVRCVRHPWILLFHRSEKDNELRLELSRPYPMAASNRVWRWQERHIVTPILLDGKREAPPSADEAGDDMEKAVTPTLRG